MFNLIEGDVFLYDGDGNKITSVLDGSDRRLHTEAKALLYDSAGNAIASYDDSGTRRLETRTKIASGHDLATEATLSSADGKLTTIDSVLDSIKDTDGVKKITDALPSGSNLIGKVRLRNPGDTADIGDSSNPVRTDPTGTTTQPISAASLPLPTGAATESTLSAADTKLGTIDAVLDALKLVVDSIKDTDGIKKITDSLPAGTNNIGDVDVVSSALPAGAATEATLLSADGRLTTIDSVLDSIKDTDGVKKITDALPVGDNIIGRTKITDGTLVAAVIADNSINRLESRSSIVGQTAGTGSEKKVSVVDDTVDSNVKRLQTQALIAPGSTVNIGTSIPADPANLVIAFLENSSSHDMLVDGSTTPVTFEYAPVAGKVISVESLLFVFAADDFEFDGMSFGPNLAMTTGIETKLIIDSSTTLLFTIKQNEDFLRIPGRVPVINNTGPKDLLSATFGFGGLIKLHGDDSDKIQVVINDDLTSTKYKYLTATIYGTEE